jgi:hypothetical protein
LWDDIPKQSRRALLDAESFGTKEESKKFNYQEWYDKTK